MIQSMKQMHSRTGREEEEEDDDLVVVDEDGDDEDFDLTFIVPVYGATDELSIPSDISYNEFASTIAEAMEIRDLTEKTTAKNDKKAGKKGSASAPKRRSAKQTDASDSDELQDGPKPKSGTDSWSGLLMHEDSMPDDWTNIQGVLVGIQPNTDKSGIG
ncbi:hypothetical protein B0H19DRAFT_1080896 [Mycena capillaripes]|nr:hypothetical protein B0H19DRAFT_1080896 [Mycena capillaripes]